MDTKPIQINRRSKNITEGKSRAPNRSMYYAMGYQEGDFKKPMVGVANGHSTITPCNALLKSFNRGSAARAMRGASALPVANIMSVSDVEVSPSIVTALNVSVTLSFSRDCRATAGRGASVKTNESIVAISGAIMPAPGHIGATDHLSFLDVGVPGFQAVQDYVNYDVRTHHTNMDTGERIEPNALKQAATVMAVVLYQAAMREGTFPKPAPPKVTTKQ